MTYAVHIGGSVAAGMTVALLGVVQTSTDVGRGVAVGSDACTVGVTVACPAVAPGEPVAEV